MLRRPPLKSFSRFLTSTTLLTVLMLCFPLVTSAVSLAEYQLRLKASISALEKLGDVYDQPQLDQASATVKSNLPKDLTVETEGVAYKVDNSWLYNDLHALETANGPPRDEVRNHLVARLRAVDERVAELDQAKASNKDSKAEADRKLQEILQRSEYAKKNKQSQTIFKYIERFLNWIWQFLPQRSIKQGRTSSVTLIAEIVVVALALGVLIYGGVKLGGVFSKRNRARKVDKKKSEPKIVLGERLEPDASATDLLAEAEALARKGEVRAAIRKAYIALLVELGERKVISLAQHKTNRDYLRSVKTHPSLYRNMSGLTDSFEKHWYGVAQSSDIDWHDFRAGYLAALRTND